MAIQTVQSIRFNQDFFQGLLALDPPAGYSNFGLEAFAEADEYNSVIYSNFLSAIDPEGKYLDMESVVTLNLNDKGISFFGPSIFQGNDEHMVLQPEGSTQNLVLRVANSFVPIQIKGQQFICGNLQGKLFGITENRFEDGKTVQVTKPAVQFSIPKSRDFVYLVEMRPAEGIDYLAIDMALTDEEPIFPLLNTPKTGGSGGVSYAPMIQLVYSPGKSEKSFTPFIEIPVVSVEAKDKKNPQEGQPKQFYVIHVAQDFTNPEQFDPKTNNPVQATTAFYATGNSAKALAHGFDQWYDLAADGNAVLKIMGYKINGERTSVTNFLVKKSIASLPAPTTITVPALASASV